MSAEIKNSAFRVITLIALILFIPLFILRQIGALDFWWWMSLNLTVLLSLVLKTDTFYLEILRNDFSNDILKKIVLGVISAICLYFVFFSGDIISRYLFNFASRDIHNVYGFRGEASPFRIALLMLGIIGPGEELFWRGYIQRHLQDRFGKMGGFLLGTAIYTCIHIATGNVMLILAALVCGLFWGGIYMLTGSLFLVMVSHTLWDIAVFILFPFN